MSTVTRPRGPLPARIYWTRRLVVIGLALGLAFGLAHLLGGGSQSPQARPVGAAVGSTTTPSPATRTTAGRFAPRTAARQAATGAQADSAQAGKASADATTSPTPTPLAMPTGPCAASDVRVEPRVAGTAYAGSPVTFRLRLTTLKSPACTWQVGPGSVVLKLTSGIDRIWSTQDCQAWIRRQTVVVRKDHAATVPVTWEGQRSDGTCSRTTPWAEPGSYHVEAAALGAEPSDYPFVLHQPQPQTITPSPTPTPHDKGKHAGQTKKKNG